MKTAIAPMLPVRKGGQAVEFYKSPFGAREEFRIDGEGGAVVARLSVDGAEFWVADESGTRELLTGNVERGHGADGDDRGRSGCCLQTGGRGRSDGGGAGG